MLRNFWRSLFPQNDRPGSKRRRRSSQPEPTSSHVARWAASRDLCQGIESLERREVLTVLTVTSLADTIANDGQVTLREAIQAANTDTIVDGVTGSGADTIQFDPSLTASGPAAITLGGTELLINSDLTINGPGADNLTIDGNNQSRIFHIADGNTSADNMKAVSISGLTLTKGKLTGDSRETAWGAAIFNRENLTVTNALIRDNSTSETYASAPNNSSYGGAVSSLGGNLTLIQSTISNNSSNGYGGGICQYFGTLHVSRSTISGNSVGRQHGGGIAIVSGEAMISQSQIFGNTANKNGGGIYERDSRLTVQDSTISGNTAGQNGGGVFANLGTLNVLGSTISGNSAARNGGAIGIDPGAMSIFQSTITGNSAGLHGGGIQNETTEFGRSLTLRNSVVAGNVVTGIANDFETHGGSFSSESANNLIGDPSTAGGLMNGVNGNIVGNGTGGVIDVSTVLNTTLADNGGPTKTHALVSVSPARNAGNNSLIPADTSDRDGDGNTTEPAPFDQRGVGFARVLNGTVDLGAVEFVPSAAEPPVVTVAVSPASVVEDGSGNLIFTLTRDVTSGSLTVNVGLSGTATSGSDYSADATNSVTFADGSSTATITVDPSPDTTAESDETVIATISSGTGYQVGSVSVATGTILNAEALLSIAASSASKSEGNSGNTSFTFTVTRAGSTSGSASVNYAVTGSSSSAANVADFGGSLPSGTISFAVGETTKTITINVSGDTTKESDEGFTVTLSSVTGASLGTSSATGAILNDDTDPVLSAVLIDIAPGATPSSPEKMTNINGTLFFTANDGVTGAELWKSDGTPAGTTLIRDIRPGS
ncbi:MAG: hypothetical protein IAG10_32300, partial [Planctomycetaceae bacterium]|nr:hypothetical protein [Planctomycetaceae bacterium]